MVRLKINKLPNIHIVERYLDTIKPLGIKTDSLGLDYFIPEKDIIDKNWIPGTHREKYVVYGIGGQKSTKRLPFDKMIELCAKINMPIILVGAKQDEETGNKLEDFFINIPENKEYETGLLKMNKKTKVYNAAGKFNINQSASIIKGAEFVFTHDTAVMHIAAAFRKKIFTIWGNTIPLFGMYPYRTKFWVFENNNLDCRPCSKIGFNKCPKKHFKCMNDIVFDFYLE
jgi:ADP-heptose:LPS heptosyltransferase